MVDPFTFTGTILLGAALGAMISILAMGSVDLVGFWQSGKEHYDRGFNDGWAEAWHAIGVWREDQHPAPGDEHLNERIAARTN